MSGDGLVEVFLDAARLEVPMLQHPVGQRAEHPRGVALQAAAARPVRVESLPPRRRP